MVQNSSEFRDILSRLKSFRKNQNSSLKLSKKKAVQATTSKAHVIGAATGLIPSNAENYL